LTSTAPIFGCTGGPFLAAYHNCFSLDYFNLFYQNHVIKGGIFSTTSPIREVDAHFVNGNDKWPQTDIHCFDLVENDDGGARSTGGYLYLTTTVLSKILTMRILALLSALLTYNDASILRMTGLSENVGGVSQWEP
jgi:hypothetical protein